MALGPRPSSLLRPIYAATALSMASYALVSVALPFRFEALGLTIVEYGAVVAVFALGMLVLEGVWGALTDRVARRGWIAVLGAVVAAAFLAAGRSTSFVALALTFTVLGATMIYPVPLMRWVALTARGPGTAGRGTGRYAVFFGGGIVVGSALGPVLYEWIGFAALTVVAAGVWAVSVGLLLIVPWPRLEVTARGRSMFGKIQDVFTPYFGAVALLVALFFTCYSLTTSFLQYYSVRLFGGTAVEAGYVVGAARGTALVAGLVFGTTVDRWGPPRSAPFGFLLLLAGALGTYAAPNYAGMVVATIVFAAGAGWLSADLLPLALMPVRRDLQGTAVGVFGSFEDLGLLVGPLLISGVYAAYGPSSIFLFVGAVAVAGAVAATWLAATVRTVKVGSSGGDSGVPSRPTPGLPPSR